MTFLITLVLSLLGIGLAAAVLRATLADGRTPSWNRVVVVAAVALVAATGLPNAGATLGTVQDRIDRWGPVPPEETRGQALGGGGGVDPAFIDFAKPHLLRGDTFFVSRNAGAETQMWLNYRFAPNLAEDRLEDADWLVYWREPDPFKTHRVSLDDVVTHLKWGPDVGLIRIRREG
ncbi:MAG TPA: hypothetical protein VGW10_17470 [Solirubrobacteraceae bacterium]|nr:hypothetical protein [Solirubrobacteraceae bacterium]